MLQKIFKNDRFTIAFPHEHIFKNIRDKKLQKNQTITKISKNQQQKIKKITIYQIKIRKNEKPSHAMPAPLETLLTQFRKAPGSTQLT